MTLRHFRIFSEVCRLESITLAAESMNMAQPAVSYVIKEMENYYETKLFERMNRRLYITEAGEQLLLYADSILAQFDEARDVLRDKNAVTKVKIGTNVSYGISCLPILTAGFLKKYPEIPLYTLVENSRQIEEKLLHNELDFGIMDYPIRSEYFISSLIKKETMSVVCAENYSLPQSIQIQQLQEIPLLLREDGSGSRSLIENILNKYKILPNIVMESSSDRSLIEACSQCRGILFLTTAEVTPYMSSHKLREVKIEGVEINRYYYLVYHKSKFLTKSMKFFKTYIEHEENERSTLQIIKSVL